MSASESTKRLETTLTQDIGAFARHWLRDRRVLIALAIAVVGAGAALNWGWLVAIGLAPLLLSLAPCAVMCALGVCMMGRGGQASCSKGATDEAPRVEHATNIQTERLQSEAQPLPATRSAAAAANEPEERPQPERQALHGTSAAEPVADEEQGQRELINQGGRG